MYQCIALIPHGGVIHTAVTIGIPYSASEYGGVVRCVPHRSVVHTHKWERVIITNRYYKDSILSEYGGIAAVRSTVHLPYTGTIRIPYSVWGSSTVYHVDPAVSCDKFWSKKRVSWIVARRILLYITIVIYGILQFFVTPPFSAATFQYCWTMYLRFSARSKRRVLYYTIPLVCVSLPHTGSTWYTVLLPHTEYGILIVPLYGRPYCYWVWDPYIVMVGYYYMFPFVCTTDLRGTHRTTPPYSLAEYGIPIVTAVCITPPCGINAIHLYDTSYSLY